MRKLTCAILVAITGIVTLSSVAAATPALADGSGAMQMPLAANWRACDGTPLKWVGMRQDGRAEAQISTPGSDTVAAAVTLATAAPDTYYNVRLIQTPRPSQNCAAGDPGVISGGFQTDAVGAGGVTVTGPIKSGATGAWVVIDTPSPNSQTPVEFYTGTYIAAI